MNSEYEAWVAKAKAISGATKFWFCALGEKKTSATALNETGQTVGHWYEGSSGCLSISKAKSDE